MDIRVPQDRKHETRRRVGTHSQSRARTVVTMDIRVPHTVIAGDREQVSPMRGMWVVRTNVLNVARAREVLSELVEGYRHHSVCRVEGLLQCVTRRLEVSC